MADHTFVICAYKDSPYLEACIRSLKDQKSESVIKLATSTPSDNIEKLCLQYNIEYCVRYGKSGIADDWNYAYSVADLTRYDLGAIKSKMDPIYDKLGIERRSYNGNRNYGGENNFLTNAKSSSNSTSFDDIEASFED